MNDEKLILTTTLSYLIVSLLIYTLFYFTTIFHQQWHIGNLSRYLCHRYSQQTQTSNKVKTTSLDTVETSKVLVPEKNSSISSSVSSNILFESETILLRTIRSYGLFLCTFLFLTNWFRIIIYLFPTFYPHLIGRSSTLCFLQSYFLHVFTLFHLNLTISIRLFWHYCFIFSKYWQNITYYRLFSYFLCLFFCLCLLTWPSITDEWASIKFDRTLKICIVNYAFHFSYTFFIFSFTCLIPFLGLMISHYSQMKSIKRRLKKYLSTFHIEQHRRHQSMIIQRKNHFQYASYVSLIWSLINIILLICIHIPIENGTIFKSIVFVIQMFALLFEPILYIWILRSLAIVTLLRPSNEIYL